MYYSLWDIQPNFHFAFSKVFPDLRNNLKSCGSALYECSTSYGILKRSFAVRILITPSAPFFVINFFSNCHISTFSYPTKILVMNGDGLQEGEFGRISLKDGIQSADPTAERLLVRRNSPVAGKGTASPLIVCCVAS